MDVNENDAVAALKVWANTIATERGILTDPSPRVLNSVEAIGQALRGRTVDALACPPMNTGSCATCWMRVFIGSVDEGRISVEYVVLVHQDGGIRRIEDLRGRSVAFYRNSRTSLAPVWLDTVLLRSGFPRGAEFCRVTRTTKLSNAVLPVFFRKTDACVVTRRASRP